MSHPFQNFDSSKLKIGGDDAVVADAPDDGNEPVETEANQETPTAEETDNQDENINSQSADNEEGENSTEVNEENNQQAPKEEELSYGEEEFKQDVNTYLSESTNGRISTPEQVTSLLQENESLKVQLKNKQLEFPSEQARKIYEFATKPEFNGNELGAARQYLHLQSLDLTKLSPKEKQFEAFVLARPDLSRETASKIFEARHTGKYSEMEENLVLQDEFNVETRNAEQKILDYQKDFEKAGKSAQPTPQEEVNIQELEQNVNAALSDFDGIAMQFGEGPDETVQLPMNTEEVSVFKDVLVNPIKLLDQVVQSCTINGKLDMDAYQRTMYKIVNVDRAIDEAYRAGLNLGQLKLIQERKNTVVPKNGNGAPAAPKKNFAQTMADAVKGSQRK